MVSLTHLLLVKCQLVGVYHGVNCRVTNVLKRVRRHVETDRAIQDHARELKQGVERECANVRLGPSPPQTLPI